MDYENRERERDDKIQEEIKILEIMSNVMEYKLV